MAKMAFHYGTFMDGTYFGHEIMSEEDAKKSATECMEEAHKIFTEVCMQHSSLIPEYPNSLKTMITPYLGCAVCVLTSQW